MNDRYSNLYNDNLLVNAEFRNPINSSGKTTFESGDDIIDNWLLINGTMTIYENTGLIFTFDGEIFANIMQHISTPFYSDEYTATVQYNDRLYTGSVLIDTSKTSGHTRIINIIDEIIVQYNHFFNGLELVLYVDGAVLTYAKLERGTISTRYVAQNHMIDKVLVGKYETLTNPNILINCYFRINQRVKSSYTEIELNASETRYTVDMWQCYVLGEGKLEIKGSGGIVLTKTSGTYSQIAQRLETTSVIHGLYSASVKINGVIYEGTVNYVGETVEFYRNDDFYFRVFHDILAIDVVFLSDGVYNIDWVKLEYGGVVTSYITPSFAEELTKCQCYYENNWYPFDKALLQDEMFMHCFDSGDFADSEVVFTQRKLHHPSVSILTTGTNIYCRYYSKTLGYIDFSDTLPKPYTIRQTSRKFIIRCQRNSEVETTPWIYGSTIQLNVLWEASCEL